MEWVHAKLHYCQSANHQRDYDSACSAVCNRQDNKQWNPYRSDCSGFVSWAHGLPPPGRVTGEFAPFENDITTSIASHELRAGDAINSTPSEHIMLFVRWTKNDQSEAEFLEEPGCSSAEPYAKKTLSSVTHTSDNKLVVHENGMTFQPIRFKNCA
jgi:hypothetical protein